VPDYEDFSIIGHQVKEILQCCIVLTPVMTGSNEGQFFHFYSNGTVSNSNPKQGKETDRTCLLLFYNYVFQEIKSVTFTSLCLCKQAPVLVHIATN
jgi:hypothetical protein